MATGIQTGGHPAAGPVATGGPRSDRFLGTGWPRALWLGGAVLFVTMLVHIGVLVATGGPWTGPVSLRKPATFAETGWLVTWSVALILPTLRTTAWQRHVIGASTLLFGWARPRSWPSRPGGGSRVTTTSAPRSTRP